MPEVIIDNICIHRNDRIVLNNLSFNVESDSFHALHGQSGSGKSSVLKIISGLLKPVSGTVYINGNQVHGAKQMLRFNTGMIFQQNALLDSLTVRDNILLALSKVKPENSYHKDKNKRVDYLLERTGLSDASNLYPFQLSWGMKKRTGIARALAPYPDLLLCDDPIAGLDPETSDAIQNLIIDEKEKHCMTIIWTMTDISALATIATKITSIDKPEI